MKRMAVLGLGDKLKARQIEWAATRGITPDPKGYVPSLDLNLFQPMSPDTVAEFSRGSGGELRPRRATSPPKIHALHSSSVLACNAFDYWRTAGINLVAEAFRIDPPHVGRLTFEAQFPTGLPGNPPNLDVALWLESGQVWAIESKFTEPFGRKKSGPAFKAKYFPAGLPVWTHHGLPRSAMIASALQSGSVSFGHLDAAQLLKHALGLQIRGAGRFTLCYLYVGDDAPEGSSHEAEILQFREAVSGDFPFVPVSYQAFLRSLRCLVPRNHAAYFAYMAERYGF
ncbi:MAG: hypothetical protein LAP38_08725 [Acidobacteriia bacterium]|nr:hypothetical protein [Terriglobia bacterium]